MHNRQGLSVKNIWAVIVDWRMWPLYILGLTHMRKSTCAPHYLRMLISRKVPVTPPQTYLTLSLRNLGFNTTASNLLSIPSTVLGLVHS